MVTNLYVDVDSEGFATATVRIPDRTMNVLTTEFIAELSALLDRVAKDASIRGVILTAEGKTFIAGADLKELVEKYDQGMTPDAAFEFSHAVSRVFRRMERCGKPFVAAINGIALGGGFELCLACHYRLLADTSAAVVGFPEVKVGLLPGAGGTQRTTRLLGVEKALPLLLEGTHVKPADALKLGLVHAVLPAAALIEAAKHWLRTAPDAVQPWDRKGYRVPGGAGMNTPNALNSFMMASAQITRKTFHNYPAPIAIVASVFEGSQVPLDAALRIESSYFATLLLDPVSRNLIRTTFINKGLADKLARRPTSVPPSRVEKIGVLGAGMMGAGIAHVSARAGMQVLLLDRTQELADRGKAYSSNVFASEIARGRATEQLAAAVLARIESTTDYSRLKGCDLVIEAVFESRDIKVEVSRQAELAIGSEALLASNTSTLPITGLALALTRPASFIGIHFFSPVEKMALVEVIVGEMTSEQAIARALDYVAQLKKTPIVVRDGRGFYANRVFGSFVYEGMAMLAEGIAPALIENAACMAGMPMGPLAISDEVTLELQWNVVRQTERDLGDSFAKPLGYDVLRKFVVELQRPGRRYGKGFYDYPQGAPKQLWGGLQDHYPLLVEQPDVVEVKRRLLHVQALESARCLEEGVIAHPADADLGSVLGWGFPAYTGGVLSYIDTLGLRRFVAECAELARQHGSRFEPSEWLSARAAAGQDFHQVTKIMSAA